MPVPIADLAAPFHTALAHRRLHLLAQASLPPEAPRAALLACDGRPIGSIEPPLAEALWAAGLPLKAARAAAATADASQRALGFTVVDPRLTAWQLVAPAPGEPTTEALAALARWLHANGHGGRWRDELLAVTDAGGHEHGRIERAAVRPLGITTFAVHLVGFAEGPDGTPRQWVQQRALDKATDPGLWDTLMGGQRGAGETPRDTLARETWEEAGLRLDALDQLRDGGRATLRRPVSDGYLVEHIDLFEAVVPAGLAPENRDGEVAGFDRLAPHEVAARVEAGAFTLEAALMMARATDRPPPR